jgi:hypothetical protein
MANPIANIINLFISAANYTATPHAKGQWCKQQAIAGKMQDFVCGYKKCGTHTSAAHHISR